MKLATTKSLGTIFALASLRDRGKRRGRLVMLCIAVVLWLSLAQQPAAGNDVVRNGVRPNEYAKSKLVQDPAFAAWKRAQAERFSHFAPRDPVLDTSVTQYVVEPEGGTSPSPADFDDNSPRTQ